MRRETIGRGIYRDTHGYTVRWRDAGVPLEKRFPRDTPLDVLRRYRETHQGRARKPTPEARGSFIRDCARTLRLLRRRPSIDRLRSNLRAWVARFATRSRFAITRADVLAAVADWQTDGLRAGAIQARIVALRTVFRTLDPEDPIACCHRTIPTVPRRLPRGVPAGLVVRVAAQLYARELHARRPVSPTWRARFMVLATTGVRPVQLARAQPADVLLEERVWIIDPAKGGNGVVLPLNDNMIAAWRLFIAADAWGPFKLGSYWAALRAAGWPKGLPPYTLRHETGQAADRNGVDLGDIQLLLGHKNIATTRRSYVPGVAARLRAASAAIDGRFPADAFRAPWRAVAGGRS